MADNDVKIKVSLDGADAAEKGLRGIGDGASDTDSKLGKLVSGGLKGAGMAVLGFATAAVTAGAALTAGVLAQTAQYEQNIGGIETMFKGSAGKMEQYAAEAYKTAGLSANEYMSQATSFSAALLQGLGGDTEKAAEVANRAITDMSDNAAKFGSNIGDIQNAYQGFAKQNYTMLDNLKLGYGGTASEMARLVNESGVMGDSFTATAENINSVSYDQIIAAIGAVQDKMGITGTTAAEAAQTISGSVDMLKGSFANLLAGLGRADADVATLAGNVITSFETVLGNVVPVIENIGANIATLGPQLGSMMQSLVGAISAAIPAVLGAGVAMIDGLITGITGALPSLVTALVPGIVALVESLSGMLPLLVDAGAQAVVALVTGLAGAAPQLVTSLTEGITGMVASLIQALPLLLEAGIQLVMGLAQGILESIPIIIEMLPTLIDGIVQFIISGVPMLLEAAIQLFTGILDALPQVITQLVAILPTLITSVITALLGAIPLIIQAGITLLTSLVTALPQIITTIVAALPQIITSVITAVLGAIPQLIQAGIQLFIALIGALPQIISTIIAAIPQIIGGVIGALIQAIPQIISTGVQVIGALAKGFPQAMGTILGGIGTVLSGIWQALQNGVGQVITIGGNIVRGIWEGISGAAGWLFNQIGGFVNDVMANIGSFFGIASPSKRMRDEIGAFLPSGIGVGVTQNEDDALRPIEDLNRKIMDQAVKLKTDASFTTQATLTQTVVPMQLTPQRDVGPINVEAALDPRMLGAAISDAFSANDRGEQAAVMMDPRSVAALATAIVDAMRVQSRQGVVTLG
ncbi:tape measure protein [Microbacterium phage WilliamStrong]|nr:tape measure protein [Microbacterium phage WilliamStrong]